MVEQCIIRQETKGDYVEVFQLISSAFGKDDEAQLVDALRNDITAFIPQLSIVADFKNKVVGHILFTKIHIQDQNNNLCESLALAPLAVCPKWQKKGIGGQLIQKGLEVAKNLGFKSVIVLGHEHYYPKFGFQAAKNWKITAPFDVSSNAFMAIELVDDGLKNVSGVVIYSKGFEIL